MWKSAVFRFKQLEVTEKVYMKGTLRKGNSKLYKPTDQHANIIFRSYFY